MLILLLEGFYDCILEHKAEVRELEESKPESEEQSGCQNKYHDRYTPNDTVDEIVDTYNEIHHIAPPKPLDNCGVIPTIYLYRGWVKQF